MKQKIDSPKLGPAECAAIHAEAHAAGIEAALKARPEPMHVTDGQQVWKDEGARAGVAAGACGFAWVNIKPGNGAYAKWACGQNYAAHGRPDIKLASKAYQGGVEIWVGIEIPRAIDKFGQSVDIKYAYARGYATVLKGRGIHAVAGSRLD